MHLCIRGSSQPLQTAAIENAVVHEKAVAEKIALNVFYRVFNLSLALRIGTTAHIDGHFCLLPELLKFVGVDNISGIFAHAHNAVLVENHFTRHSPEVSETVVAHVYQVCRCKRTALHFGIFVSGCGKQKGCCVDSGLPAVNIRHQELAKVNLHLLPHRKLRNGFIVSRVGGLLQAVFLTQPLDVPGDGAFPEVLLVVLLQPVADLRGRESWISSQPVQDLVPVIVQTASAL